MVVDSNRLSSVIEKVKSICRERHAGGCLSLGIRQGNTLDEWLLDSCYRLLFHTIISLHYNSIIQHIIQITA